MATISAKFQRAPHRLPEARRQEIKDFAFDLLLSSRRQRGQAYRRRCMDGVGLN